MRNAEPVHTSPDLWWGGDRIRKMCREGNTVLQVRTVVRWQLPSLCLNGEHACLMMSGPCRFQFVVSMCRRAPGIVQGKCVDGAMCKHMEAWLQVGCKPEKGGCKWQPWWLPPATTTSFSQCFSSPALTAYNPCLAILLSDLCRASASKVLAGAADITKFRQLAQLVSAKGKAPRFLGKMQEAMPKMKIVDQFHAGCEKGWGTRRRMARERREVQREM